MPKLDEKYLEFLHKSEMDYNTFTLQLPNIQLDRKVYLAINKFLEACGGKWNRKRKCHEFCEFDFNEKLLPNFTDGEFIDDKKEFGFFETPENVIQLLLENILFDEIVIKNILEPSAGTGVIVDYISKNNVSDFDLNIDVIELNATRRKHLENRGYNLIHDDFLTFENPDNTNYDLIIANPPFNKQDDIRHVSKMIDIAKDDCIIRSVMSNSVTFRENKLVKEFYKKLYEECDYWHIEPLSDDSFKESGTKVKTVIIHIEKWGCDE